MKQSPPKIGDTTPQRRDNGYALPFTTRKSDAHMDILDLIGGHSGATKPSLNQLAVAYGFPGKRDVAGDEAAEMYLEGRIGDILRYNADGRGDHAPGHAVVGCSTPAAGVRRLQPHEPQRT